MNSRTKINNITLTFEKDKKQLTNLGRNGAGSAKVTLQKNNEINAKHKIIFSCRDIFTASLVTVAEEVSLSPISAVIIYRFVYSFYVLLAIQFCSSQCSFRNGQEITYKKIDNVFMLKIRWVTGLKCFWH